MTAVAALSNAAPAVAAAPPPPMRLPSAATASTSAVRADPATWLVGARPTAAARALVHAVGGTDVLAGAFEVPRAAARPLAARLRRRGLLTFAEPNRYSSLEQTARAVPDDPFDGRSRWRDDVIDPALAPPPVTPSSPRLALVDAKAAVGHPEFRGDGNVATLEGRSVRISHGTETLGVAVAPANSVGIVGVYPGARAVNVPLPSRRIACSDSARAIRRAVRAGAAVINMSYGSGAFCFAEYIAIQLATHANRTLVAAGGNERGHGNPYEFPASLPHVLTVGASTPQNQSAFFSNTSAALDLVAPGVGIVAPLPLRLDGHDQARDGYGFVAGTSFSAPIVSAAALWLRTVNPALTADQVAGVLRASATDIERPGYDVATGFGKLNLARALVTPPPSVDPLEPNEDIPFVSGRVFRRPAPAIWKGGAPVAFEARLDVFEDPSDVYRVRVPAHKRVTVTVKPVVGNPDLDLYSRTARHVATRRHRLARSRHNGARRDSVRYRNRASRSRVVFVRAYVRGGRILNARYRLTVKGPSR